MLLEELLLEDKTLKKAIEDGKLVAFADDVLLIADDEKEAEKLIRAMEGLERGGLVLNKQKTSFLTD